MSKKEKQILKHDDFKNCLINFIYNSDFDKCLQTARIEGEARYLNGFAEIRITEVGNNKILVDMRTNGESGFTSFKQTYTIKI